MVSCVFNSRGQPGPTKKGEMTTTETTQQGGEKRLINTKTLSTSATIKKGERIHT